MSLAIPLKGVPLGLSAMQSNNADGSVTITDAYTYGADPFLLYQKVIAWATQPDVSAMLDDAARQAGHPVYLRVVSRVYLAGSVAVAMTNNESGGAGVKAGADVNAAMFNPEEGKSFSENYAALISALDTQANKSLPTTAAGDATKLNPGGAVKFTWASQRSVSLNERFDTPLCVGYLGLDVPVFKGQTVGTPAFGYPVASWAVLRNADVPGKVPAEQVILSLAAVQALTDSGDPERQRQGVRVIQRVSNRFTAQPGNDGIRENMKGIHADATALLRDPDRPSFAKDAKALYERLNTEAAFLNDNAARTKLLRVITQEYSNRAN
jgi:hypothetical protein